MNRIVFLLLLLIIGIVTLHAQSDSSPGRHGLSIGAGVSYGIFDPRHAFIEIYGYQIPHLSGNVMLGYNYSFVIVKYRKLSASGNSKVSNITVKTSAEWKEELGAIGLRQYADQVPFYIDAVYILLRADESITTIPRDPKLTASSKIQDHGFGLAIGFAPQIIGPLGIDIECEWNYMFQENKDNLPNLGGLFISGGIHLILN
jgi:hypothetical protein